jgi:hypothetical protein
LPWCREDIKGSEAHGFADATRENKLFLDTAWLGMTEA